MPMTHDKNRTRRQRLTELGLCAYCGHVPPRDGRTLCADCADKQYHRNRRAYDRLKATGRCIKCREFKAPEDADCAICSNCRRIPASKPCANCGGKRDRPRAKLCDECLHKGARERRSARRRELQLAGVCACRDHPPVAHPGGERCEQCLKRQRNSMNRLNRAKRRGQNQTKAVAEAGPGPGVTVAHASTEARPGAQVLLQGRRDVGGAP